MYSDHQKVLIVLSYLELSTARKCHEFLEWVDSPTDLWQNPQKYRDIVISFFGDKGADKLFFGLSDLFFDRVLSIINKRNAKMVTFADKNYPHLLREIADPPLVLYCKGDTDLLNAKCAAIVGSRKCSQSGKRVAEWFATELKNDFCVVSGLANGIDTAAHKKTLELGGKTIAVLAGGFDNIYPSNNTSLAEEIAKNGLLVSEVKPSAEPLQYRFPMRNRVISGLSDCVVLAEAGEKSGAFTTVDFAAEQGRDVFIVPSDVFNFSGRGSNRLLKDLRTQIALSPDDVKDYYKIRYVVAPAKKPMVMQFNVTEQKIIDTLKDCGQLHFDVIVNKTGLAPSEVNYSLTNLLLSDIVFKFGTNIYQLNAEAIRQ